MLRLRRESEGVMGTNSERIDTVTRQRNRAWMALSQIEELVESGAAGANSPVFAFVLAGSYSVDDLDEHEAVIAATED